MRPVQPSRRTFLTAAGAAAGAAALAPRGRVFAQAPAGLNLGIQLYSLRGYKVEQALEHARDLGFKFVEFYSGMFPLDDPTHLK